jgi:hypothetical protein
VQVELTQIKPVVQSPLTLQALPAAPVPDGGVVPPGGGVPPEPPEPVDPEGAPLQPPSALDEPPPI